MYARLLASSSLSLATAGGVALTSLPLPFSVPTAVALAMGAAAVLAWRDRDIETYHLGKGPLRSSLVVLPTSSYPELTREPDPAFLANEKAKLGRGLDTDYRLAAPTTHEFKLHDRIQFTVDDWHAGETLFRGQIISVGSRLGFKVACDNGENYFVPRGCLTLVGEGEAQ